MKHLLFLLVGLPVLAVAQTEKPIQRLNPDGLYKPAGYRQVITVAPGTRLIYLSGQVPQDSTGKIIGGDMAVQTRRALANVLTALQAVGADFRNVVKINWYVVNLTPADVATIRAVRDEFIPADARPASTLVGVPALFDPAVRIEIEVVAALPA